MERKTLAFIAIAYSMIYGVWVGNFHPDQKLVSLGGVLAAILWIAVGVFGRSERRDTPRR